MISAAETEPRCLTTCVVIIGAARQRHLAQKRGASTAPTDQLKRHAAPQTNLSRWKGKHCGACVVSRSSAPRSASVAPPCLPEVGGGGGDGGGGPIEDNGLGGWGNDVESAPDSFVCVCICVLKNLRIMLKLGDFTVHPVLDQF